MPDVGTQVGVKLNDLKGTVLSGKIVEIEKEGLILSNVRDYAPEVHIVVPAESILFLTWVPAQVAEADGA